jgi:hypothetical protein
MHEDFLFKLLKPVCSASNPDVLISGFLPGKAIIKSLINITK